MEAGSSEVTRFQRPTKRLMGFFNKGLGPLPDDMPDLRKVDDIEWDSVTRYRRIILILTVAMVASTVLVIWHAYDWTHYSVITGAVALLGLSDLVASIVMLVFFMLYFIMLSRVVTTTARLQRAALAEEMWFRSGCESWSWPRRLYSCVLFGLVHLYNLVVPIAAVFALTLGGAVMMAVYLREYRKTRSSTRATLVSSLFHRDYNDTVIFALMPVIAVGLLIYLLLEMF